MTRPTAGLLAALLLLAPCAHADDEKEAPLRLDSGSASEWSLDNHARASGPALSVEFEGFSGYEIEVGTSALRRHGRTEWNTDLTVKKQYSLSPALEFEAGLGPEWTHSSGSEQSNSAGIEADAELIWWPSATHRLGWYIEPGYGYSFGDDHERSFSLGLGLTVALP